MHNTPGTESAAEVDWKRLRILHIIEAPELLHYYDGGAIEIILGIELKIAVLKYKGVQEESKRYEKKKTGSEHNGLVTLLRNKK